MVNSEKVLYREHFGVDLPQENPETHPEPQASDMTPHLDVIDEMMFYGMTEERLENLSHEEVMTLKMAGML